MEINGINLDGLCHKTQSISFPDVVPGRVVQIDADFLAYQCSVEYEDEEVSIADMKNKVDVSSETLRLLSGAEKSVLHLTPKGSNKGGRYDLALLKEYQANRKGKDKPRYLHLIREWMHKERGAELHFNIEADDGMAIEQYRAAKEGNSNLCIIASKDKDLCMVPGLQLNWDSGDIHSTEQDFGYIWLDNTGSSKKIKGFGWKFFWAQMLMGDQADNISGVPFIAGPTLNVVDPTAAITKAIDVINNPYSTPKQQKAALNKLDARKPKKCGAVLTYKLLEDITSNKLAYALVKELYRELSEVVPFVNYRDGAEVKWGDAFLSEAYLLWMRRDQSHIDVHNWIAEHAV